jgi:zinc protease
MNCAIAVAAFALLAGRPSHAAISIEHIELPNQLVVLVSEEHSLPFVTLLLLADAGSWRDPPFQGGLGNLTAQSLLLGTENRSASEINEMLDFMGTDLKSSCSWDYVLLRLKSLRKELDGSFDLFMDILTQPAFLEAEVQKEKEKILGKIQAEKDDPIERAKKNFREAVFLQSPYSHPVKGTKGSLAKLTRDAVVQFYRTCYRPNASVLAVVGDITPEEVSDKLAPRLSQWSTGNITQSAAKTQFAEGPKILKENLPISQANIVLGHGGIERSNPDYHAVSVMNRILGGGSFSSRLMEAIRIKKGLAYSVYSRFVAHKHPGSFQIVLQTKNSSASEAIDLTLQEMRRMKQEAVSEEELDTAKKYLIGNLPLRVDTQPSLAAFMAQAVYYELGLDYAERYPSLIGSVNREDVLRVSRKYLHPDACILSVVGNLDAIEESGGLGFTDSTTSKENAH